MSVGILGFSLCNTEYAAFLTNSLLTSPPPAQLAICICMGFANAINTEAGAGTRERLGSRSHLEHSRAYWDHTMRSAKHQQYYSLKNKEEKLGEKRGNCSFIVDKARMEKGLPFMMKLPLRQSWLKVFLCPVAVCPKLSPA